MQMVLAIGQFARSLAVLHLFLSLTRATHMLLMSLHVHKHTNKHTHTWNTSAVKLVEARRKSLSPLHILPEGSSGQLARVLY